MLKPGLYEKLINKETAQELEAVEEKRKAILPLDQEESPAVLSQYVARILREKLAEIGESDSKGQLQLVNDILEWAKAEESKIVEPPSQLTALLGERDDRLVNRGNSLIVIEHNIDVIRHADYLIDMGPEGGIDGGKVLCTGTPEEVKAKKIGETCKYL